METTINKPPPSITNVGDNSDESIRDGDDLDAEGEGKYEDDDNNI